MLIRCKIKRPGGSRVTLGSERYHFQDRGDGLHVAEVTNDAHIERLLSIGAYAVVEDAPEPAQEPAQEPVVDGEGEALAPAKDLDLEALREAYTETFGKAPHPRMKAETIQDRLEVGEA